MSYHNFWKCFSIISWLYSQLLQLSNPKHPLNYFCSQFLTQIQFSKRIFQNKTLDEFHQTWLHFNIIMQSFDIFIRYTLKVSDSDFEDLRKHPRFCHQVITDMKAEELHLMELVVDSSRKDTTVKQKQVSLIDFLEKNINQIITKKFGRVLLIIIGKTEISSKFLIVYQSQKDWENQMITINLLPFFLQVHNLDMEMLVNQIILVPQTKSFSFSAIFPIYFPAIYSFSFSFSVIFNL